MYQSLVYKARQAYLGPLLLITRSYSDLIKGLGLGLGLHCLYLDKIVKISVMK